MTDIEVEQETENPDAADDTGGSGSEKPDWEAKAKAHYAQLKEARDKVKTLEEQIAKTRPVELDTSLDWRQAFSLKNEGYSEQEILSLGEMSEKTKMPVSELVKNPIVKAGIESARSKAKEAAAVPVPSNRSTVVEGKPVSEIIKDKDAFKQNFDKIMEKYRRS